MPARAAAAATGLLLLLALASSAAAQGGGDLPSERNGTNTGSLQASSSTCTQYMCMLMFYTRCVQHCHLALMQCTPPAACIDLAGRRALAVAVAGQLWWPSIPFASDGRRHEAGAYR